MAAAATVSAAGRLLRDSQPQAALQLLRQGLRDGSLPIGSFATAGRLVQRALSAPGLQVRAHRVLVLGQCTTTWLTDAVSAAAWRDDMPAQVHDGPFDNVLQAVLALQPDQVPDVLVLLPWHARLLTDDGRDGAQRVADEVAFWQQVWAQARQRGVSHLVQVGLDWITPGASGWRLGVQAGGELALVSQVNQRLNASLPEGAYFVPLQALTGDLGRQQFYDLRSLHWTRQPFSAAGLERLASHIQAGIRAVVGGPRKLLVVDLDNTLWGGVVGEVGAQGIVRDDGDPAGSAFLAFQRHLLALSRRGVVLAVCSKNNLDDARAPFETDPRMPLSLDDIACFVANWQPKSQNLRLIAETLRLGLDSMVFFDDNPAERAEVRQACPEVAVVEVPDDPADYVRALQQGLWFEAVALTDDDTQRTRRYVAQRAQHETPPAGGTLQTYLASLQMRADLRPIDEADLPRVVQLLAKTNQFNLTTRRHGADQVRALLQRSGSIGLTLRLHDRFVDHGLVAVVLAVPEDAEAAAPGSPTALRVDSLLLSCRVIGRGVEACLVDALLQRAAAMGHACVLGDYLPTAKNAPAMRTYADLGFVQVQGLPDGGTRFRIDLPARVPSLIAVDAARPA